LPSFTSGWAISSREKAVRSIGPPIGNICFRIIGAHRAGAHQQERHEHHGNASDDEQQQRDRQVIARTKRVRR
jgi:hypothetical protein